MKFLHNIIYTFLLLVMIAGTVSAQSYRKYYIVPGQSEISIDNITGYYFGDMPAIAVDLADWYNSGEVGDKHAEIIASSNYVQNDVELLIENCSIFYFPLESEMREVTFRAEGYFDQGPIFIINSSSIDWWMENYIVFENLRVHFYNGFTNYSYLSFWGGEVCFIDGFLDNRRLFEMVDCQFGDAENNASFTIHNSSNLTIKSCSVLQRMNIYVDIPQTALALLGLDNYYMPSVSQIHETRIKENVFNGGLFVVNKIRKSLMEISNNDVKSYGDFSLYISLPPVNFSFFNNLIEIRNNSGLEIIDHNRESFNDDIDFLSDCLINSVDFDAVDDTANTFVFDDLPGGVLIPPLMPSLFDTTIRRSYIINNLSLPTNVLIARGIHPVFVQNCMVSSIVNDSYFEPAVFLEKHETPQSNLYYPRHRNRNIISPIVTSINSSFNGTLNSYNLGIDFLIDQPLFENDYYAITADNAPFVVEMYRSNYKGDLLERIAVEQYDYSQYNLEQTLSVSGLDDLPQWVALTLSAGIDVNGNTSEDPIGTSEPIVIPVLSESAFDQEVCVDEIIDFDLILNSPYFSSAAELYQLGFNINAPGANVDIDGNYSYSIPGNYSIDIQISWLDPNNVNHVFYDESFTITVLSEEECQLQGTCLAGFSPTPGEYLLSAWVKEEEPAYSYENAGIMVECATGTGLTQLGPYYAQGNIIDGWQRIEQTVNIPSGPGEVKIILLNNSENVNVYFDDIRIQPADASAKAFVYDKKLGKMRATLNDNNYATFYDYDDEGKLIRQRQETERGVMTIEEVEYNTHNGLSD